MEAEKVETDVETTEEEMNDAEDTIGDTERDLSEKHRKIVEQLKERMVEGRTDNGIMFEKVNKVLKIQTDRVINETIKYLKSKSITETNNFISAASVWVTKRVGLKKADNSKKNEPGWKRRVEGNTKRLKQELRFVERESKVELRLKKKRKLSELNERYRKKRKGLNSVIEEMNQKMIAKSSKVRGYEQRSEQLIQSRIFDFDQKKMYAEFKGAGVRPNNVQNAEESNRFWGDIWSVGKGLSREAEWLKDHKHLMQKVD